MWRVLEKAQLQERLVVLHTNEGVEVGLAGSDTGLDALEAVASFRHVTLQVRHINSSRIRLGSEIL